MMTDKYLPLGTVVLLDGANVAMMITGYRIKDVDNNIVYDYCGCVYPTGIYDYSSLDTFNAEQIKRVIFYGYCDDEAKDFFDKLKNIS